MEKVIIVGLFGLAWGSFLNVVIYRVPRKISIIRPPSCCPHCQKRIKFYDNIPVLSFILLRGKCRFCRQKISFRYPLVELLTALSFIVLYIYNSYALSLFFFASCLFTSALIALTFIDYDYQILPDTVTLPVFTLALIYSSFRHDLNIKQALIGAGVGAGFLLLVYGAYYLLRKKEGMGLGDVTMMLMIGAFLGWRQTFFTLVLASFAGALVGIFFIFFKKKSLQTSLPFGTFLGPAAYFSLVWGEKIIRAYLSLFR